MSILQIIKGVFSDIFPLHLNSSMDALEEDLTDAELSLYFSKVREEVLRQDQAQLRAINHAYRVENGTLRANRHDSDKHIDYLNGKLDEAYKPMSPQYVPSFDVQSSIQNSIVRIRLNPLEYSYGLPSEVPEGCRDDIAHEVSQNLGDAAKRAVIQESYTTIFNALAP